MIWAIRRVVDGHTVIAVRLPWAFGDTEAAAFWAWADEHLHTGFGPVTPSPEPG